MITYYSFHYNGGSLIYTSCTIVIAYHLSLITCVM